MEESTEILRARVQGGLVQNDVFWYEQGHHTHELISSCCCCPHKISGFLSFFFFFRLVYCVLFQFVCFYSLLFLDACLFFNERKECGCRLGESGDAL